MIERDEIETPETHPESRVAWKARAGAAEAENDRLREALTLLLADLEGYPASERPCHALDVARAALAKAKAKEVGK